MEKTIELDCPPGDPRPSRLIMSVVMGTAIEPLTDPECPVSTFFGNWTWQYPEVSDETWKEVQKVTRPRIVELYNKGVIRYGSW